MKTISKILAILALAGSSFLTGDYCIKNAHETKNLEYAIEHCLSSEDGFSDREKELINDADRLIGQTYSFDYHIVFIELEKDDGMGGWTFPSLGSDDEKKRDFIKRFGQETYRKLEGKDVIAMQNLDYCREWADNKLLSSSYIPSLDAETLFRRSVLHEKGHVLFYKVKSKELIDRLIEIDRTSRAYYANEGKSRQVVSIDSQGRKVEQTVYDKGYQPVHTAHPSFYSYSYLLSPTEHDEHEKSKSADEQFADIFALYTMGYIDENVEDKWLAQKIRIVKEALSAYKTE